MNQSFSINTFIASKSGAAFEECEDALAVNRRTGRFAVVDGATEAFASGSWARALAANWIQREQFNGREQDFAAWVQAVGEGWSSEWAEKSLSWFAETKRDAGSFAAFVGLEIEDAMEAKRYRVFALGDACFMVRETATVVRALPLDAADKFNSSPPLLPSRVEMQATALQSLTIEEGAWQPSQTLWLMSDALAAWMLGAQAENIDEFERLLMDEAELPLKDFVEAEVKAGRMRDDDVAVIRLANMTGAQASRLP